MCHSTLAGEKGRGQGGCGSERTAARLRSHSEERQGCPAPNWAQRPHVLGLKEEGGVCGYEQELEDICSRTKRLMEGWDQTHTLIYFKILLN